MVAPRGLSHLEEQWKGCDVCESGSYYIGEGEYYPWGPAYGDFCNACNEKIAAAKEARRMTGLPIPKDPDWDRFERND